MSDTAAPTVTIKDYVKGCADLAVIADTLGLDGEAYKLRSLAVAGERSMRRAATEAKRKAGETLPGAKPKPKA